MLASTSVEIIPQSVFQIPGISRFSVRKALGRFISLTFEVGESFSSLCADIEEHSTPPTPIRVVKLSELVMMSTAIHCLGDRWKPVSLGAIFHLLSDHEARRVLSRASDTYFQVSNERFGGIVFLACLSENSWFIDAVPAEDVSEITWLDSSCQFGYPA